jgi:hypothetical protein
VANGLVALSGQIDGRRHQHGFLSCGSALGCSRGYEVRRLATERQALMRFEPTMAALVGVVTLLKVSLL